MSSFCEERSLIMSFKDLSSLNNDDVTGAAAHPERLYLGGEYKLLWKTRMIQRCLDFEGDSNKAVTLNRRHSRPDTPAPAGEAS